MIPSRTEIQRRLSERVDDLEAWSSGARSWTNLGPYEPYTPDVIAVMDAQEVVKHSAAVQAYTVLLMVTPPSGPTLDGHGHDGHSPQGGA